VVGIPDRRYGEKVVALVQPKPGCRIDTGALRQYGRDRLTGYKAPKAIVVVDEIVRSPSGKPDYPWAQSVAASAGADARPSD
jgi:acyl-CoA synthetase (AMP-forming)/AMP-acid ligase II